MSVAIRKRSILARSDRLSNGQCHRLAFPARAFRELPSSPPPGWLGTVYGAVSAGI